MTWAIKWRSNNRLDGYHEHFMFKPHCTPIVFKSRAEARAYIRGKYGYLRKRPDLRAEPHGWLAPIPVKVRVILEESAHGGQMPPLDLPGCERRLGG